jgi:RNA polymerase sigma-70 factor, ECF subfamily
VRTARQSASSELYFVSTGEKLRHDEIQRNQIRSTFELNVGENIDDRELRDLMIRYQSGQQTALEELVRHLSPRLLRYFGASPVIRGEAEDLLQDCWIRIHRARHTYRSSEAVAPWIFAIAHHTMLDGYRKRRRLESKEVLVGDIPDFLQSPRPREETEFEGLNAAMAQLPEAQREVIIMLKISGMSLEEVAKATSSTVGAVKQKAHRAYSRLRLLLEKERRNVG